MVGRVKVTCNECGMEIAKATPLDMFPDFDYSSATFPPSRQFLLVPCGHVAPFTITAITFYAPA